MTGSTALEQCRTQGRWPASYDRFWEVLRQRQPKQEGTRAVIEALLLAREYGGPAVRYTLAHWSATTGRSPAWKTMTGCGRTGERRRCSNERPVQPLQEAMIRQYARQLRLPWGKALRQAAFSLRHSKTALGAYFRHLAQRKGPDVASFVTARKIATYIYCMLRWGNPTWTREPQPKKRSTKSPGSTTLKLSLPASALNSLPKPSIHNSAAWAPGRLTVESDRSRDRQEAIVMVIP